MSEVEALAEQWRQQLPDPAAEPARQWVELGSYPGALPAGQSDHAAWRSILALKEASPLPTEWEGAIDLLQSVDPARATLRGQWKTVDGQIVSSEQPYARIQLPNPPVASYQLETQFTRIRGDCMAIMFPAGNTSALLVVGGWKGKVSGLAYVNGKDADRNETTRDGRLSNGEKHTLLLDVRRLDNGRVRIAVSMDGKPYLDWEGEQSALTPDRQWGLRNAKSIGIGAYNAAIVFHSCRLRMIENGEGGERG